MLPGSPFIGSFHSIELIVFKLLCLDRNGLARVAEALSTALGDPDVQLWGLEYHVSMFKKAAARMEENDLERLLEQPLAGGTMQRAVLDVLGESKKRSFRNTWDYLDWRESNGSRTEVLSPGTNR